MCVLASADGYDCVAEESVGQKNTLEEWWAALVALLPFAGRLLAFLSSLGRLLEALCQQKGQHTAESQRGIQYFQTVVHTVHHILPRAPVQRKKGLRTDTAAALAVAIHCWSGGSGWTMVSLVGQDAGDIGPFSNFPAKGRGRNAPEMDRNGSEERGDCYCREMLQRPEPG